MTKKSQRVTLIVGGLFLLGIGLSSVIYAFRTSLVFFYSPYELLQHQKESPALMRLGGILEKRSLKREGVHLSFRITDGKVALRVIFSGVVPRLLKEGQGVVVEGRWNSTTQEFQAQKVLVKHDEVYRPSSACEKFSQ